MKKHEKVSGLWRNWLTLIGLFTGGVSLLLWLVLIVITFSSENLSTYFSVVTYVLIPAFMGGCGLLVAVGMFRARSRMKRRGIVPVMPVIDLGNRRTLGRLILFNAVGLLFIVLAVVAAYQAYHFTESVEFCGRICHEVMKPEYTAFQHSPHANITCTECHIGSGAKFFVKSKISGLYQVYSVLFDKFDRPIKTPVENLRPAKETCMTCHWPTKFFGAVLRKWTYYLSDEENSPWTTKMLLNIGGGDPAKGPIHGIHWHTEGVNTVEYIATDPKRMVIPWVRVTDQFGKVKVFQTKDKGIRLTDEQIATIPRRRMDCMDCHNRPSHQIWSPNAALDVAISAGRIDSSIPSIKLNAAELLAAEYQTEAEALAAIDGKLRKEYKDDPRLDATVQEIQSIYSLNFFPEMKVRWDVVPNHVGHKITPGCFRCHDDEHVSDDGEKISKDCNLCHTILAQGKGTELPQFTSSGLEFVHPDPDDEDGDWKDDRCDTCHTGAP